METEQVKVTLNGQPLTGLQKVDAPVGEPDTLVRVTKKRSGKIEVQEAMEQSLVVSRASLPPMMALTDSLEKRREDRNARRKAAKVQQQRLFDAY